MSRKTGLTMDHYLFSGEVEGEISILTFKEIPTSHVTDIAAKEKLFDYLELVSSHQDIKVLLIKNAPVKMTSEEYINFYRKLITTDVNLFPLERMYNAINQFILKLANLDKIVIHVDSGNVILLFMNISLACDYRIVAENTIYKNPSIVLNVVPKGGGVFFLSKMLGSVAASRILYSGEDITAIQAHRLNIVDQVVPLKKLERKALEKAQRFAQLPCGYSVGIKKLLNFDIKELSNYLEFENELLRRLIRSCK
jgi:2-(1,2-epoxy-1,2-dihydrophenyl)acetyl-CoA isomerase